MAVAQAMGRRPLRLGAARGSRRTCSPSDMMASMSAWLDAEMSARWAAFPAAATPRPVVLLEERLRLEGGFVDGPSKLAWLDGAIDADLAMPATLRACLPARRGGPAAVRLRITEVTVTTSEFLCDRGPRRLPAYRLTVTGVDGFCVVLDPEVECWWPVDDEEARAGRGGTASVEEDGLTIAFPAFGGALTEFHRAVFQEYDTYVVGRAITTEREEPSWTAIHLVEVTRQVPGRLASPLDGRVLVTADGKPMSVTNRQGDYQ